VSVKFRVYGFNSIVNTNSRASRTRRRSSFESDHRGEIVESNVHDNATIDSPGASDTASNQTDVDNESWSSSDEVFADRDYINVDNLLDESDYSACEIQEDVSENLSISFLKSLATFLYF
jgi:hypothetical protein